MLAGAKAAADSMRARGSPSGALRLISNRLSELHGVFITHTWTIRRRFATRRTVKSSLFLSCIFAVMLSGAAAPAHGQAVSDFSLPDVNSTSLRRRATSAGL